MMALSKRDVMIIVIGVIAGFAFIFSMGEGSVDGVITSLLTSGEYLNSSCGDGLCVITLVEPKLNNTIDDRISLFNLSGGNLTVYQNITIFNITNITYFNITQFFNITNITNITEVTNIINNFIGDKWVIDGVSLVNNSDVLEVNVSWVLDNQAYNSTEELIRAVNSTRYLINWSDTFVESDLDNDTIIRSYNQSWVVQSVNQSDWVYAFGVLASKVVGLTDFILGVVNPLFVDVNNTISGKQFNISAQSCGAGEVFNSFDNGSFGCVISGSGSGSVNGSDINVTNAYVEECVIFPSGQKDCSVGGKVVHYR